MLRFIDFISNRRYHAAHTSHKRPNLMMILGVLAKTLRIFLSFQRHCDVESVMIYMCNTKTAMIPG